VTGGANLYERGPGLVCGKRTSSGALSFLEMNSEPLIDLAHISVAFGSPAGRVAALQDVSLWVQAGERVGLVGESGSGKSTLARVMLGLQKPDQGTVRVGGVDPFALSAAQRKVLSAQHPTGVSGSVWLVESASDHRQALSEVLAVHGLAAPEERPDRVAALLEQVGLNPALAPRYPHEFSGGQRQRIALARALAVEPRVWWLMSRCLRWMFRCRCRF
jgi:ABC-type glutathione transport system ATPase component